MDVRRYLLACGARAAQRRRASGWSRSGALALALGGASVGATSGPPQDKVQPNDPASTDRFGGAVAISGDVAVIGAPLADPRGEDSGAAYIFRRIGGVWTQEAKIVPPDGQAGDSFGAAASILGTIAVIGAHRDDDNGADSGSAYVYERLPGGQWTLDQKIKPLDGENGDRFAFSLDLSAVFGGGVAIAISAYLNDEAECEAGAVYVFEEVEGDVWSQTDKLFPAEPHVMDSFGWSVAISGDDIIVGTYLDDELGNGAGAAYIFRRDVFEGWSQFAKLKASDGEPVDNFGIAVDLDGPVAVVGAFLEDEQADEAGAAYVFRRVGNLWGQEAKLLAPDGASDDEFGKAVAVDDDTIIVGARFVDAKGQDAGAAYVYKWGGTSWTLAARLSAFDGEADAEFGNGVALGPAGALIGSWRDGSGPDERGAVYSVDVSATTCLPDLNVDGIVNTADLGLFLNSFGTEGPEGDLNLDGVVNTADLGLFLSAFGSPCPQ